MIESSTSETGTKGATHRYLFVHWLFLGCPSWVPTVSLDEFIDSFPMKKWFQWAKLELPVGQLSPHNGIQGAVRPLTSSSRVLVGIHMTNVEKYSATHTKIDKDISRYEPKTLGEMGAKTFLSPSFIWGNHGTSFPSWMCWHYWRGTLNILFLSE